MSVDATKTYPALFGDGKGHYKVHIVGNTGAGKTTLGKELARILGVPLLPLDTLQWGPNWTPSPRDEFRAKFQEFLDQNPNGWVIDGNYYSVLRDLMEKHQTDVIYPDRAGPAILAVLPSPDCSHVHALARARAVVQSWLRGRLARGVLFEG